MVGLAHRCHRHCGDVYKGVWLTGEQSDYRCDHGDDGEILYLASALDPKLSRVRGGGLERLGEADPDDEYFLRDIWEEGDGRGFVLKDLKSGEEVRPSRPPG